jgi:cystathionine beta-lyase/cystathionine gamma-synthase
MKGACGLLSFFIKANASAPFSTMETIERFCESLRHISMAVSWGGHESLIIPWCAGIKPEKFSVSNEEHRMLRLYCGLEDADYIIEDLQQAFDAVEF